MTTWLLLLSTSFAWTRSTGVEWTQTYTFEVNQNGSTNITDIDRVEQIFFDSFFQWSDQNCTDWSWSYEGRTNRSPTNNGDNLDIIGFTSSWPRNYGDAYSTIGLTMAMFNWQENTEADVTFNEQVWTFVEGTPANWTYQADLQSIATHEFGHVLGLGHTNRAGSTMVPSYDDTTGFRTLGNDDVNGVCSLYPGSGGSGNTGQAPTPTPTPAPNPNPQSWPHRFGRRPLGTQQRLQLGHARGLRQCRGRICAR